MQQWKKHIFHQYFLVRLTKQSFCLFFKNFVLLAHSSLHSNSLSMMTHKMVELLIKNQKKISFLNFSTSKNNLHHQSNASSIPALTRPTFKSVRAHHQGLQSQSEKGGSSSLSSGLQFWRGNSTLWISDNATNNRNNAGGVLFADAAFLSYG